MKPINGVKMACALALIAGGLLLAALCFWALSYLYVLAELYGPRGVSISGGC